MTRSLRLEHPGSIWHVTSRGNERRDIYRTDSDRLAFLDILADVVELHRWIVYAWVLMSNHYHLLIETPQPTLSIGTKRLNEQYAQVFNGRHERVGHLFQGRFKAIHVERESHFLELLRYIVLNPVRCGAVEDPRDYRWSSYRATAGYCNAPFWFARDEVLAEFGSGPSADQRERYRQFVAERREAEYNPWKQLVGQVYLGGSEFCERMQSLVGPRKGARAFPASQRAFVRPTLEVVARLVAAAFGETEPDLRERSHSHARKALAELAWRESGLSLVAIGAALSVSPQGVWHLIQRSTELEKGDETYAVRLRWLRNQLGATSSEG